MEKITLIDRIERAKAEDIDEDSMVFIAEIERLQAENARLKERIETLEDVYNL